MDKVGSGFEGPIEEINSRKYLEVGAPAAVQGITKNAGIANRFTHPASVQVLLED